MPDLMRSARPDAHVRDRPPRVIAHRGASRDEPEHTLSAYRRAIDEEADALECDVRLTADLHLVCVHDRRVNRTSNGRGVVSALELATLEGLDWGSWKERHPDDAEEPDQDRNKLLTLRRLLTVIGQSDRDVGLAIETKHPNRHRGQVERTLATVLRSFDLDGAPQPGRAGVCVMSFSQLATQRMRRLCPQLPIVFLMEDTVPLRFRDGSLPRGVRIAGLSTTILARYPDLVRRHHQRGHEVYVYTADEVEDVDRCLHRGVDAIITNRPAFVRARVGAAGSVH
ncbi:MAG TPA: glycerophosphodiester phosphodiesterase family protein [Segeticoccus sp.]|nr:glycerophosphodiester phosphodiesterase family protein [Segeticoccus sp.]